MNEAEEVICSGCTECSIFTIIIIKDAPDERQNGAWAKCVECGHLTEVTMVDRYALTNDAEEVENGLRCT